MQRLADIELQLIMHGLTLVELLRFSRCNRQFLHAADSAFAWKYTPGVQLNFSLSKRSSLSRLLKRTKQMFKSKSSNYFPCPSSPLIHAPLFLGLAQVDPTSDGCETDMYKFESRLNVYARFIQLNATLSIDLWIRLLNNPAVQNDLTSLTMHWRGLNEVVNSHQFEGVLDVNMMKLLQSMKKLHELAIWSPPITPDAIALLPSFPCLTSLSLVEMEDSDGVMSVLPSIVACRQLTKLYILNPRLQNGGFQLLLDSPLMQQNLTDLTFGTYENESSPLLTAEDHIV